MRVEAGIHFIVPDFEIQRRENVFLGAEKNHSFRGFEMCSWAFESLENSNLESSFGSRDEANWFNVEHFVLKSVSKLLSEV